MHLVPIDSVTIPPERQRREGIDSRAIEGLKRSILERGLIHAPILTDKHVLVAGHRRYLALRELHSDGLAFRHDGQLIPLGLLPFTRLLDASEVELLEVEYDENFHRLDLSWQERTQAYVRIHELKLAINPSQTLTQTAAEIVTAKSESTGTPVTDKAIHTQQVQLSEMRAVAANLHNPVVANASSPRKAYVALLDSQRRELERDLIRLAPQISPHTLILGDFTTISSTLPTSSFDAVICDPPYGINAHRDGSGALEHQYDDSPTNALNFYRHLFRSAFTLLKPLGTAFVFCDIEHFTTIRTIAEQQAFSTFRTPLVWHKGSEGYAPWGREGPKRTYELILYAVKGQRSLVLPLGPDVLSIPRSTSDPNRVHAAEKPADLLRFLVQRACRTGDRILDPCCGSGPIFTAASGLGIHVTGVELNPEYHTLAASRLARLAETPTEGVVNEAHPETITERLARIVEAETSAHPAE